MNNVTKQILEAQSAGLTTQGEALSLLEDLNVHGMYRHDGSYIGYDYASQAWVNTRETA